MRLGLGLGFGLGLEFRLGLVSGLGLELELGLGLGLVLRLHLGLGLEFGLGLELGLGQALHHRGWIWSTGSQVLPWRRAPAGLKSQLGHTGRVCINPTGLPERLLLPRSGGQDARRRTVPACPAPGPCSAAAGEADIPRTGQPGTGRTDGRTGLGAERRRAPPRGP